MKSFRLLSLLVLFLGIGFGNVSALLEFPSSLIRNGSYEGGTLAPANTGSSFFQNLLQKVNFGNAFTPTQTVEESNAQNTTSQNSGAYTPTDSGIMQPYDAEYQKILKQNLGGLGNTNSTNNGSAYAPTIINTTNTQPTTVTNSKYLTSSEIEKKLNEFILQVNKIRSGYAATSNIPSATQPNSPQNNNITPQQQQQIQSALSQNTMPSSGFSSCSFAQTPQDKQNCLQSMRLTCQQGYIGGELLMPECSQLPVSTYAGLQYGSQPTYSLQNYVNHDPYYSPAAQSIGIMQQGTFPGQYFNREGNYIGPDRNITGNATHYACTKRNGVYTPDNFLITTYRYITAFGYKARYGTNVGDSTNSCNFNYCGVAVPLQFITATYGSKSAGKDQMIQIVNTENLKCTVAPIQDISAVRTFTHSGSNAVIDLSLCVMERLSNKGSIRVQYKPLKKGEIGCNQSFQANK